MDTMMDVHVSAPCIVRVHMKKYNLTKFRNIERCDEKAMKLDTIHVWRETTHTCTCKKEYY